MIPFRTRMLTALCDKADRYTTIQDTSIDSSSSLNPKSYIAVRNLTVEISYIIRKVNNCAVAYDAL